MDPQRISSSRTWFMIVLAALFVLVITPFLAPLFMYLGWEFPARAIYFVYSFLCHQLPQRSYFLFGSQFSYPLGTILNASGVSDPNNILALRQFIGNPEMGWKVAWSDRMISMYTSIPLAALVWYPLRRRLPDLPLWGFLLMLLPMALDGGSHFLSDVQGAVTGFRASNLWLANLTGNSLPPSFYAGDAWGSFNSIMRMVTGLLFGMGIVWYGFPYLEEAFS